MENGQWITIIGCGPGSHAYVTPAARNACAKADVAVGSPRTLGLFPEFGGERIVMGADVGPVLDAVARIAGTKQVAVLVTGDSGVFSLAASFIRRFGSRVCRLVPGISSVQVAFARIGLDWVGAEILSAHHQKPTAAVQDLAQKEKIALLAGRPPSFGWIAQICEQLPGEYCFFACEDLTLETENIRQVDTAALRCANFSARTVVLIIRRDLLP